MRSKFIFGVCILLGLSKIAYPLNNNKQTLEIKKTDQALHIDGVLDEDVWSSAAIAKNFIQFEPYNGQSPSLPTEVKVLYDDHAIYFGAVMYDNHPDSIIKDLGVRDEFSSLNSDLFTVIISTFNDGVNASEFMVSASGVQSDGKHNGNRMDKNWDAVWESKVNITEFGWVVEMKIPYSALRFSKNGDQTWGIHFFRHIRRHREWSTWNYVDN
ncbi:MAG: carbohydrate binding family 9 domain-containing protein, partial [Bacteroidales bacterium]